MKAQEIIDVLMECSDFLDNYTDAEYVDGRPVGNRAMNLKARVDEAHASMERQLDRTNGDH
jgi:hypothetical protein